MKLKFCFIAFPLLASLLTPAFAQSAANQPPVRPVESKLIDNDRIILFDIGYSIRQSLYGTNLVRKGSVEEQRVRQIFENRECSCSFTIQKNGSVMDVAIFKKSGSGAVDEKAVSFVKKTELFKLTEPLRCVVYFPSGIVRSYKDSISPIQGIP